MANVDIWIWNGMVLIKKGNIAVFCSGGEGNLPEFVCESEERADELIEYFDRIKKTTSSMLMFPQTKVGRAEQVARDFSDKGLYYKQCLLNKLPYYETANNREKVLHSFLSMLDSK